MGVLAERAQSLVGRKCTLQDSASLAVELCGLLWQVLGSPETVAASCLASLSVSYPGLLMASAPFDQAGEIAERLDAAWLAAQADPAAAVVELPSVMLQRVTPESHGGRPRRVRSQPQVDEPELIPEPVEADQQLDGWGFPIESQPAELVNAAHEQHLSEVRDTNIPRGGYSLPIKAIDTIAEGGALPELEPEPEPSPAPLPPAPAGWFTAAEAAELLGISRSTIVRWCKQGRLGEPGENWLPAGRTFKVSPEIIELLLGVQEPAVPTCY